MKKYRIYTMTIIILGMFVALLSATSYAKPGPVLITTMERAEWHSDVISVDPAEPVGTYDSTIYLYTLISAYRKLDKNVSGSLFYIHKFDATDGAVAAHTAGLSVTHDMTGKWRMSYNYLHNINTLRNPITAPHSVTNRLSLVLLYKFNPGEKYKPKFSLYTTFNTGTNFTLANPIQYDISGANYNFGRTMSEKIQMENNISKKLNYEASYSFVWGVRDDDPVRGVYKTQFANQYELNFNYKLRKDLRLTLGDLYLNNLYNGAVTDDNIIRLSVFKIFQ